MNHKRFKSIKMFADRLLRVTKAGKVSSVFDACCGSGGFLIAAMGKLLQLADGLAGVTTKERSKIKDAIKNSSLFGVDAGSDPAIYRIARMNMYLHGDGGSHIYHADALDKQIGEVGQRSAENTRYIKEIRELLNSKGTRFDVILSNPPFSLKYTRKDREQSSILNQYEIGYESGKQSSGLLSSVMFLERYRDLVSDDGEILAIIDESVLSGDSYKDIRDYIRSKFIIIGVISLPGDAFRRASARVKTSILILRIRHDAEEQTDVFMASAVFLGLEPKIAKRIGAVTSDIELSKEKEIKKIVTQFSQYRNGIAGSYCVSADKIKDRLDVKYCIGDRGRKEKKWLAGGRAVVSLDDVLKEASGRQVKVNAEDEYQFIRVNYGGEIFDGDLTDGDACSYSNLYKVKKWDIIISSMGACRGAVGIVSPYNAGKFVSKEYMILTAKNKEEAVYYASLLRTKEILADILAATTGMNRARVRWADVGQVRVPKYSSDDDIKKVVSELEAFWAAHAKLAESRASHLRNVVSALDVENEDAQQRWLSYKPPE